MATKPVSVCLLAAIAAAIAVIGAASLAPREAKAAMVTVKTCGGGNIEVNGREKRMLELHNKARTVRGLEALCVHPALTKAARAHSQEMLDKDYSAHNSFNGESVKQRLERFGYSFSGYSYYVYGENITWGCGSLGTVDYRFDSWMSSSGHRGNILNTKFRQVGIGVRTGTFKTCTHGTMYTVDFGTRRR
ncbi:MAG TPA: CAP domain-containing protein [Rubrobacter sp.]|nr:CAP domain-containing protein [Rubrobacter sp.]